MPLDYPSTWSALDRALVDQAVDQHQSADVPIVVGRGGFIYRGSCYASDAEARTAVLAVLTVVADVLSRRVEPSSQDAADLRDQLIVWAHPRRPAAAWPRLEDFAAAIHEALAVQPWWSAVTADLPREARSRSRQRVAGTYPNQARWLQRRIDELQPFTLNRLATLGGPDRKTLQRLLDGYGAGDEVLVKLAQALTDASGGTGRPKKTTLADQIPRN